MQRRLTDNTRATEPRGPLAALALSVKSAANGMARGLKRMVFPGWGGQSGGNGGGRRGWLRRMLPGSAGYDYEAEAGELWLNSAIACCIGWVRRNFPEPRLTVVVRRGTEWVENPDHPVLESLEEPNPAYTDDVLWGATCLSAIVDGNAYWIKAKASVGPKRHYWYVPHWQMKPCWPGDGSKYISHYEYYVDGKIIDIPADQVIHYRFGLDPENERLGWSELKTCLREACADNEANTYTAAVLKNMGIVSILISPESDTAEIDEDDAKDLVDNIKKKSTGANRGNPVVVTVPLKTSQLAMSPEKMMLDKIRMVPESRICAAIGTPAQVVGLAVGELQKAFRSLAEANRHAYNNCLIPMQKSMAKDFQRQSRDLMKGRREERLVWRYDEVEALREDQAELTKRLVVAVGGPFMTVDEARSRAGLKPTNLPENQKVRSVAAPGDKPTIGGLSTESEAK